MKDNDKAFRNGGHEWEPRWHLDSVMFTSPIDIPKDINRNRLRSSWICPRCKLCFNGSKRPYIGMVTVSGFGALLPCDETILSRVHDS